MAENVPPFDPDADGVGYVYQRVADHLAAQIISGELRAGARLAGEIELATELGVSVGTVRRAMQVLVERGLVVVLPAKGRYVAERGDQR